MKARRRYSAPATSLACRARRPQNLRYATGVVGDTVSFSLLTRLEVAVIKIQFGQHAAYPDDVFHCP